jgi:hypothetical protein
MGSFCFSYCFILLTYFDTCEKIPPFFILIKNDTSRETKSSLIWNRSSIVSFVSCPSFENIEFPQYESSRKIYRIETNHRTLQKPVANISAMTSNYYGKMISCQRCFVDTFDLNIHHHNHIFSFFSKSLRSVMTLIHCQLA